MLLSVKRKFFGFRLQKTQQVCKSFCLVSNHAPPSQYASTSFNAPRHSMGKSTCLKHPTKVHGIENAHSKKLNVEKS